MWSWTELSSQRFCSWSQGRLAGDFNKWPWNHSRELTVPIVLEAYLTAGPAAALILYSCKWAGLLCLLPPLHYPLALQRDGLALVNADDACHMVPSCPFLGVQLHALLQGSAGSTSLLRDSRGLSCGVSHMLWTFPGSGTFWLSRPQQHVTEEISRLFLVSQEIPTS